MMVVMVKVGCVITDAFLCFFSKQIINAQSYLLSIIYLFILSWPCFKNPTPMKLSSILIIENIPQQQVPLTNKCTTCQHLQQCYQNKVFTKLSTGQSDGLFLPICGNPGKSRGSRSRSCRHCVQVSWLRNTFQCGDKIYVCRAGGDSLVQAPLNTNKLNL